MRLRIRTAILSGLLLASNQALAATDGPGPILPEVTTRVALSNTDVNRLVCPEGLKDVVFSQEKGIVVKISGGNAFVKFQAIKQGEEMSYSETPSEFHVVCGGEIYSLIGLPQRIPAQTIRLSSGKKQTVEKNRLCFKSCGCYYFVARNTIHSQPQHLVMKGGAGRCVSFPATR